MKADLHMHSKYSDGMLWPAEIVERAKHANIETIALTDHDTMEGVAEFLDACKLNGIKGIAAVEIDYDDSPSIYKSEILGYFPNREPINTKKYLAEIQQSRIDNAKVIIEKYRKMFPSTDISFESFIKWKINDESIDESKIKVSITKPDIYDYLKTKGCVDTTDYITFKNEITFQKKGLKEWIKIIKSDAGFPVLAHPANHFMISKKPISYEPDNETIKSFCIPILKELKRTGLWGIELHAYEGGSEQIRLNTLFEEIAKQLNINVTYGSDSHFGAKRDYLGNFIGDFKSFPNNWFYAANLHATNDIKTPRLRHIFQIYNAIIEAISIEEDHLSKLSSDFYYDNDVKYDKNDEVKTSFSTNDKTIRRYIATIVSAIDEFQKYKIIYKSNGTIKAKRKIIVPIIQKTNKTTHLIQLYDLLYHGSLGANTSYLCKRFNVHPRTIRRYIDEIIFITGNRITADSKNRNCEYTMYRS
jgi:3',5'-nucleoside bisphosphate phosphatase